MAPGWKILRHSTSNAPVPPLLVKYEFGASQYKIWVTDLTHIWAEILNQRPLIQRAWDIDLDIDPIEADQRQMLLEHIRDALDEAKDTKLVLSNETGSNNLTLKAYCPLPKPLRSLQWPFHLVPAPPMSLSNELVLPLLGEVLVARNQVSSLLAALKDKDHVISKLTDKVQAEGIELGKVFPSANISKSNRKALTRKELGESVPGLGTFNESHWRLRAANDYNVPSNGGDILTQLSSKGGNLVSFIASEQSDTIGWWESIGAGATSMAANKQGSFESQSQRSIGNDFQVGDIRRFSFSRLTIPFQRQATPDRLNHATASGHPSPRKLKLPQRESNPKSSAAAETGVDSGANTNDSDSHTEDDDLDELQPTTQRKQESDRPNSSSESHSPEPASSTSKVTSPKPRAILGRIGGVAKPVVSPHKPKLGHVGGMNEPAKPSKLPSKSPEPRGRPEMQTRSPSPIRETSQERADRKREALKRELEEKSKVGVKKKRKF
ncbi:MAG: hypothetical protein Q9181_004482 [Wetmoreana brouardii]